MTRRRAIAVAFAACMLLGGCSFSAEADGGSDRPANTDPRKGWVVVGDDGNQGVTKACDGTTLIYLSHGVQKGGITVVPSSPECARAVNP